MHRRQSAGLPRDAVSHRRGDVEAHLGVILYDETIRQNAKDGTPLVKLIEKAGSLPGIKVDKGTQPLPNCPGEVVTEELDGLRPRLVEYRGLARSAPSGAR